MVVLKMKGRKTYTIVFELDCGTEPVDSAKSRESLDRMLVYLLLSLQTSKWPKDVPVVFSSIAF